MKRTIKAVLISAALFIAALPPRALAQNLSTVTAVNITDASGNKLASGKVLFQPTDSKGNHIPIQIGGGGMIVDYQVCALVVTGAITTQCPPNSGTFQVANPGATIPSGIYYQVTIQDSFGNARIIPNVTWSGATFNLDTFIPATGSVPVATASSIDHLQVGQLDVFRNLLLYGTCTGCLGGSVMVNNTLMASPFSALNLANGAGVTVTDAGSGKAQFSLAAPTTSILGGVKSLVCSAGSHIAGIDTSGAPSCVPDAGGTGQVNGTNLITQNPFNFQNGTGTTASNPSAGNIQIAVNYGTVANTAAQGNDSRIVNAEQTPNKDANSGYAGLDSGGKSKCAEFPVLTGDVTTPGGSCAATLPNIVTAGTNPKITYNAKGQVTGGAGLASGDIPNNAANTTGNAGTATALAATPSQCSANNFSTGVAASGNANCAQPATANLSDGSNVVKNNQANSYSAGPQDLNAAGATMQVANDTTTGTANALLAKLSSTGAIKAGTSDIAVPLYIVDSGGGTSGNAKLAIAGQEPCKMDATASNTEGFYVVNSTTTANDCHAQSAVPSGVFVVGHMVSNSTTAGSNATIAVDPYFASAGLATPVSPANGGTGLASPTTHSIPVTEGASNINLLTSPTANGNCIVGFNVTAGVAVDPTCSPSGVGVIANGTAMDYTYRAALDRFSGGSTATLTLCQVTGTCANNFPFVVFNGNSGLLTITANAADKINGGALGGSVTTIANWARFFYQDASSAPGNWWSDLYLPTYAAFGATCGDLYHAIAFSTASGFSCQAIANPVSIPADSGAANAYVIAPAPAFGALALGEVAYFTTANANSGASTINVNGLGVVSLTKKGGTALVTGDILANAIYKIVYNTTGPRWELFNPSSSSAGGSLTVNGAGAATNLKDSKGATWTISGSDASITAYTVLNSPLGRRWTLCLPSAAADNFFCSGFTAAASYTLAGSAVAQNATSSIGPAISRSTTATINTPAGSKLAAGDLAHGTGLYYEDTHQFSVATNVRMYVGFTDQSNGTMVGADVPAGKYVGFYASTTGTYTGLTDTTHYVCVSKDGTTQNAINSTVAFDTSSHKFEVIEATGGGSFTFKIDGNAVCGTDSTNIPASGTITGFSQGIQNLTASAINDIDYGWFVSTDK